MSKRIVITGGAGFIGSHFVERTLSDLSLGRPLVIDALTYAGNKANLPVQTEDYDFVHADITDFDKMFSLIGQNDTIVHLAAESHVDRSITGPLVFTKTNTLGTHTLLEVARQKKAGRFLFVSTDEVYGSLGPNDSPSIETSPFCPRSPYSASKAAADHLVQAYHETFGIDTVITRGSNTYGPRQYPEKLIPLFCKRLSEWKKVPVYGEGTNIRDWLHVKDHVEGIFAVLTQGQSGQAYNIGGGNEMRNIDLTRLILAHFGRGDESMAFVEDRKGHDFRYSLDCSKAKALGWKPKIPFNEGLTQTLDWYRQREVHP